MKLLFSTALLALSVQAFQFQPISPRLTSISSSSSSSTSLSASSSSSSPSKPHQFNGGYDASAVPSAKWNPREASEFVLWHMSDDYEEVGRQLQPLIQTWSGKDLGEFLSRLYLGEIDTNEFEIKFESRHVRTPQWKGLDTPEGVLSLKCLLRTALPDDLLKEPIEMARVAEVFLWKERTWPTDSSGSGQLERDSFANQGYTGVIVQIWMELREERGRKRHFLYSSDDVLEMVPAPSKEDWGAIQLKGMQDFFVQMGIRLAPSCKIALVQGMATGGWNPGKIAKFVSNIPEIAEDVKRIRVTAALEEAAKEQPQEEPVGVEAPTVTEKPKLQAPPPPPPPKFEAPRPPMEKGHLDNVSSYTKYLKETESKHDSNNPIQLPATNANSMVSDVLKNVKKTQEFFEGNVKPAQVDALEAVRKKIQASQQRSAPWQ
jgi:hypothetical protein